MQVALISLTAIAILLVVLGVISLRKAYRKKAIERASKELREHLPVDNRLLDELYLRSEYLRENFQMVQALRRKVLYGHIDGHLILIKYKKNELRIGFPSTFRVKDVHFDVSGDFSAFGGEKAVNLPDQMGAENYLWYVLVSRHVHIQKSIAELLTIKAMHDRKDRNSSLQSINDFDRYLEEIKNLGYPYL
jgi:hypothetical protein